jgi:hypothetical protein
MLIEWITFPLCCIFAALGIYKDLIFTIFISQQIIHLTLIYIPFLLSTETIIYGAGSHYVIMLHGLGGSPNEFKNLYPLFNSTEYTVIIPYMYRNMEVSLDLTTNVAYGIIDEHIKDWDSVKSLSFIGNSLGGLISKKVLSKLSTKLESEAPHVKLENFINLVTPHHGIFGDFYPINLIRIFICTLLNSDLSLDLLGGNIINNTETQDFKRIVSLFENRISYALSTFDSNVPFWSQTLQGPAINIDHKMKYDSPPYLFEGDSLIMSYWSILRRITQPSPINSKTKIIEIPLKTITEIKITSNEIDWKLVFVPINSLLNHGNIVGKHLHNDWITPNKKEVLDSIKHIKNNFKK